MNERYPEEILAEYDDDGTMVESRASLEASVVGHKIVHVQKSEDPGWGSYGIEPGIVLTLDNGKRVTLVGQGDCCAYTAVEAFLLHPERVDHIITGVGTTDGYQTWHIFADMGDVLELTVAWSPGNPFYYGYGFHITVSDD